MIRIKALLIAYRKLSIFNKIALIVNLAFAILLFISYLSAIVGPRGSWFIAFLGLTYQFLLFVNILFAFYWAFQFKGYVLISALVIVLGWGILINNVGLHFKSKPLIPKPGKYIRIMTFNVHNFMSIDSPSFPVHKQILNLIRKQQPDIIAFEEYYTNYKQVNVADSLTRVMHSANYFFQPLVKTFRDSTGIAIYSKYPIVNYNIIPIASNGESAQCIYVDLKLRKKVFRVYCVHLESIEFEPEDYHCLHDIFHFKRFSISGVKHVLHKMKLAFEKRGQQVENFKAKAEKCPYPYIVTGDFNDTPSSYAYNEMSEGLNNSFRERGYGVGKTYNGNIPKFQIDYILASKQFDIYSYNAIKVEISDHFPVCADVALNN